MCEKNHYGRRAATILLAVLTALLVLSYMNTSRAVAFSRPYYFNQSVTVIGVGGGTT